jgi:hypothetical protein
VPIGLGLAWLGYALWSHARTAAASSQTTAIPRPQPTTAG